MKKVFAILLSVLLVCALVTAAFAAFESSSCALTADKTELKRGDTFTVTATLTNTEAVTLATVALQFDEAVLELVGGECLVPNTMLGMVNVPNKAGTCMVNPAAVVSGDIYTFQMKVKDDAAFGDVEIINVTSIGNGTGNVIASTNLTVEVVCDHNYGAWTDNGDNHAQTCSVCGDVKTADHAFGAWTDNGADHKATCDVCGGEKTAAHTFDKEVVADKYLAAEATCTAKATYFKSCECGAKGTETFESGEKAAHVFDKEVATAEYLATEATCTAKATYYKSCVCGEKGTETFAAGELAAHVFDKEVASKEYEVTAATCTTQGTYNKSCECGAKGTETFVGGELAAHEYTKEVEDEAYFAAEATCTSGKTYYKLCAACDAVSTTETFEVGEPIAHTFDKEVVDAKFLATEATCKAKATYYKSCVCGAKGTETFESGELGEHKFDEGKVTVEPTTETKGVKTYTCEVCGETKTEEIDVLAPENKPTEPKPTEPKPTEPKPTEPSETKPTGDNAVLMPMILLVVMSICGMAVVLVMKKRAV